MTPEERFQAVVDAFGGEPDVTPPLDAPGAERRFGGAALKVNGKIFAMLVRDRFVLKLPRERVAALIAAGDGEPFDTGPGRVMKEWVALSPASGQEWQALARQAKAFVGSRR
jgi:hypothetical protein